MFADASETDKLEEQVNEARKEAREQVRQVKTSLDTKLAQLEKRAEKLAAENFELTMDNEEVSKKMKVTTESLRKMEREVGQAQVEKEWLISQQKNAAGTSEKAGELAAQLDQTKTELREEKTKVCCNTCFGFHDICFFVFVFATFILDRSLKLSKEATKAISARVNLIVN